MLNGISKILTGDMLKVLSDMGHGDVLILGDANFPGEAIAKTTSYGKLIRCPGISTAEIYEAISELFPLDVAYTEFPVAVMEVTASDRLKGMTDPAVWKDFETVLHKNYPEASLGRIDRFDFYDKSKKAYAVIVTGEERPYGNLLLVKGCVL